jgi:hypothetical protein
MENQVILAILIAIIGGIALLLVLWVRMVRGRAVQDEVNPASLEALSDARIEDDEFVATPIGEQIEEMVRERLKSYPDLENVSMDFGSGVDGSLQVWLDSVRYDRIQDIPDERIRQAVADAVEEFNR